MENLDGTIVTTSLPRIGQSLHVPAASTGLVITAYLVTLGVLIPLGGWMSSRFGARRVFLSAIVVFTLASIGCALSTTLGELVALRVLQGAGGAMMVPVGRFVVLSNTAKSDIVRIMSYIVWPGLLAPVIAPLAGGLITTYASWHWLFLINAPLGVLALVVAWRLVDAPSLRSPARPDHWGALLTCGGLVALTYAAHLASGGAVRWPAPVALAIVSVVLLAVAGRHLLRVAEPLVNLRTLRFRTFRTAVLAGSLFWLTVGAMPFLLPLLFQGAFGWSPVKSGALVLCLFLGNIAIKPATGPLLDRLGYRAVLVVATAGVAATTFAAGFFTPGTAVGVIALVVLLSGIARSVGLTAYTTIAFTDIPEALMRDANTLAATAQQLSIGLGVAAAAIALRIGTSFAHAISAHPGPSAAYTVAFGLMALVPLMATVDALRLERSSGDALRGPRGPDSEGPLRRAR